MLIILNRNKFKIFIKKRLTKIIITGMSIIQKFFSQSPFLLRKILKPDNVIN